MKVSKRNKELIASTVNAVVVYQGVRAERRVLHEIAFQAARTGEHCAHVAEYHLEKWQVFRGFAESNIKALNEMFE